MQEHRNRWGVLLIIALSISSLISAIFYVPLVRHSIPFFPEALIRLDFLLQDRFVAQLSRPDPLPNVAFLGIDQSTLKLNEEDPELLAASPTLTAMAQPYPWSRAVWGSVIERLAESGAEVIIIDFLFPTTREGDAEFAAAVEKFAGQVVLAGSLERRGQFQTQANQGVVFAYPSETILPVGSPVEEYTGFVNFIPDIDGRIRKLAYKTRSFEFFGGESHPDDDEFKSLTAAIIEQLERNAPTIGRTEMCWVEDIKTAYPVIPLHEIFIPSFWERNFGNGSFFKGKIVMIGVYAPQFQDIQSTPEGDLNGPLLHLNALTNVIHDSFYKRASGKLNVLLVFLGGLAAIFCIGTIRKPIFSLIALIALFLLLHLIAAVLFDHQSLLISLVSPISSLALTGLSALAFDYSRIYRERLRLRKALGRRVSSEVMEEIIDNPESYLNQLGGVRRDVTVLFSDLRGFTKMSETREPEELVSHLNEYFNVMVPLIQEQRGMVDKFIGDAIMALWGSVPEMEPIKGSEYAAVTAVKMKRSLAELNSEWKDKGIPSLAQGIGVHRGEALTGNIGSDNHHELTAIGDTVNLASRLESVTKQYGAEIIVSECVADFLIRDDGWILRPLDRVKVVGRNQPVDLIEIIAMPGETMPDETLEWASITQEAFSAYQEGDFQKAIDLYSSIRGSLADKAVLKLRDRCRIFLGKSPGENWDGSVSLDSK